MPKFKICPGKANTIWAGGKAEGKPHFYPGRGWFINNVHYGYIWEHHLYVGIKRIKIKCELCGRKVWSSIDNTEDGDLLHKLPPHKEKHWWKSKKTRWDRRK